MVIAVAGLAGAITERTVDAGGHVGSLVGVAGGALNSCHFGRVRVVLDGGVTIGAAQNSVDAGRVLCGVNRDALAAVGLHAWLAVAGEATLILLERLGRLRMS
jgi:hypothetical protein